MKDKNFVFLSIIFVFVFILNSYILFFKPLHEDAYFSLHYIDMVKKKGLPLTYDPYSYSGRGVEEPPFFYYLLALFSVFNKIFLKLIPVLLISSLVIIIFIISSLFLSSKYALIPALLAGFTPALFKVNIISPISLALPILFLLIYFFLRIEDKRFLYAFVFLSTILPLTSPLSIFFIFSVIILITIASVERKRFSKLELEALLFSLFVNILLTLLIFKNSFLYYGPAFVWQNIPEFILKEYFKDFAFINTLGLIGVLSLVLGVFGFVFSFKEKKSLFLASFLISSLVFLWLKLIPFYTGLIIFSLTLSSLSALSLRFLFSYLKQTKFSRFSEYIFVIIIIVAILTSMIPSLLSAINFSSKISVESFNALSFLKSEEGVILAPYEYGHAISYLKKKNVADSSFLLAPNPERRLKDISLVYKSQSETFVLEILKKYNVKYIIFDNFVKDKFGVKDLLYAKDTKCFTEVYVKDEVKIYEVKEDCR